MCVYVCARDANIQGENRHAGAHRKCSAVLLIQHERRGRARDGLLFSASLTAEFVGGVILPGTGVGGLGLEAPSA